MHPEEDGTPTTSVRLDDPASVVDSMVYHAVGGKREDRHTKDHNSQGPQHRHRLKGLAGRFPTP